MQTGVRPVHRALRALTSARAAVLVMALLALLSLVGSMIPQGHGREAYVSAYGRSVGGAVTALGLDRVFHTAYYAALLVVLVAMVFACSLKGLPARIRAGRRSPVFDERKLEGMPCRASLTLDLDGAEADLHVRDVLKRRFYSVASARDGGTRSAVASKMGFARYGTFVLHLSFIFLLAGGIALAKFGSHDYRTVAVGSAFPLQVSSGDSAGETVAENVEVVVEDFDIEFDSRGRLSDYICDLALRRGGEVLSRHRIRPNHPLTYAGKEIYLNSFAEDDATPSGFVLAIHDSTGRVVAPDVAVGIDQETLVDEVGGTIRVPADGAPRVEVVFDDGSRESHMMRQHLTRSSDGPSGYQFLAVEAIPSLVVTLEVVREPGQWLVIVGLALLSVGVFSALYLSHRVIWSIVRSAGQGKSRVVLAGLAARNKDGFSREFETVRRTLEELA